MHAGCNISRASLLRAMFLCETSSECTGISAGYNISTVLLRVMRVSSLGLGAACPGHASTV